jgi:hypothetical protein
MPADILGPGDWVRVKIGIYEGDPAYVTAAKNKIRLLLVPHISYEQFDIVTRTQRALFDPDRARAVFGGSAVQQVNNTLVFKRMTFKDGLLEKVFPRNQLIIGGVRPTSEEIELFSQSPQFPRHSRAKWEAKEVADALCLHDRIEVVAGDLKGKQGVITGKYRDVVQVHLSVNDHHSVDNGLPFDLPAVYVRKSFEIGDYIQVRSGIHASKYGYVTMISLDGTLEFVEWDKSGPRLQVRFLLEDLRTHMFSVTSQIYDPNPRQHNAVYTHSVDFADEQICLAELEYQNATGTSKSPTRTRITPWQGLRLDPTGTRVVVVSGYFRGYYGTIQYLHKPLKIFGVRLDFNGKLEHFREEYLIDLS